MAYPPKEITVEQYQNYYIDIIENIEYDKIYYLPKIIDGIVSWRILFYNAAEPDESPYFSLKASIDSEYRVLLTRKRGIGNEQLYFVEESGYDDDEKKPWVRASMVTNSSDINFENLPIGTVVYWVVRTFFPATITKYSATITGHSYKDGIYARTYLDYGIRPVVLPTGNLTAEGVYTTVYDINVCIIDTDGIVIENGDYNPTEYGILEILPKNEAIIFD